MADHVINTLLSGVDGLTVRLGLAALGGADPMIGRLATVTVLTGLLVFTLLILNSVIFGRRARGDTVLLLGPVGAGKTALFYRLYDGSYRPSVSSLAPNSARFTPVDLKSQNRPQLQFVDFPGHLGQRLRLKEVQAQARAVVFVADATGDAEHLSLCAAYLYSLLTDRGFVSRRAPLLIWANKQDAGAATARTAQQLADALLPFIDKRRAAASVPDSQLDSNAVLPLTLGSKDATQPFAWSQAPVRVSFGAGSVAAGDLSAVNAFLSAAY